MSFYRKHERVPALVGGPTRTKQSHKDECDINNILRQYRRTGVIQHIRGNAQQGQYLDLPSTIDYQMALETVRQAGEAFESLPAKVRQKFNNDPEQFLEAFSDPSMTDELIDLGLVNPPAQPGAADPPAPQKAGASAAPAAPGGGTSSLS